MVMKMKTYSLPQTLNLGEKVYAIRTDWRAIYDICEALQDNLSEEEKLYVLLTVLFKDPNSISDSMLETAIQRSLWFISGGDFNNSKTDNYKLIDWEQDFPLIIAAINRVAGCELRSVPYLHWWTFLSYFQEIGDCLFSRVTAIRAKRAKHTKLDKSEQEFLKANRHLIVFKNKLKSNNSLKPSALLQSIIDGMGNKEGEIEHGNSK